MQCVFYLKAKADGWLSAICKISGEMRWFQVLVLLSFCRVFDNGFDRYLNVLCEHVKYIMAITASE